MLNYNYLNVKGNVKYTPRSSGENFNKILYSIRRNSLAKRLLK